MIRAAPVPLLLLATLAACNAPAANACPGDPVVSLDFTAALTAAGALPAGLDPSPALSDCGADPAFPTTVTFAGTFASGPYAALCRKSGTVLTGSASGTRWSVSAAAAGAALPTCGASCTASLRVTVTGDLDASADPAFSGALVEALLDPSDCGTCVLPCAGRYALTGRRTAP